MRSLIVNNIQQQLQQAYTFIRAGRLYEAREILNPITSADPGNVDAWWLLANAQSDPAAMRDALKIVLQLRPDHKMALDKLRELDSVGSGPFKAKNDAPASLEELLSSPLPPAQPAASGFGPGMAPAINIYGAGYPPVVVRRRSPCLTVLMSCFGTMLCLCIVGVALTAIAFQRVSQDPTLQAAFSTLGAVVNSPDTLPPKVNQKGALTTEEPRSGTLGDLPDTYTFSAAAGQKVTLDLTLGGALEAGAGQVPILMGIYNSDGRKVAGTSLLNIMNLGNLNTLLQGANRTATPSMAFDNTLTYTFTSAGQYTILIQNWPDQQIPYRVRITAP